MYDLARLVRKAPGENRTHNLSFTKAALYQLSYRGEADSLSEAASERQSRDWIRFLLLKKLFDSGLGDAIRLFLPVRMEN